MNRRILCLVLALVLCLSVMACGKKQPTPAATGDQTAAAAPTTAADAAQEATSEEGEKTDDPAAEAQKQTEAASVYQPGVDTTLPPDVEVSMGAVEGVGASDLDDDASGTQAPAATTPTAQPEEEPSQIGDDFDVTTLTYEFYNSLSGADQQKIISMFGSPDDFIRWYKAVEAKYMEEHPGIEIGEGGIVDAGNLGG